MTLHLIPSVVPPPDPLAKVKKMRKPAEMLQCPRCAGRETIVSTIGALMRGGKLQGGTKQVLCVCCLMRGERVVIA